MTKKEQIFVPLDFKSTPTKLGFSSFGDAIAAAEMANDKLQKLIDSWPVLHSYNGQDDWFIVKSQDIPLVNYKARLAFIQEIVKEPELCKHELIRPNVSYRMAVDQAGNEYYTHLNKCKQCGAELQATWTAK